MNPVNPIPLITASAVMLGFIIFLQTRRVSSIWLRWLPRLLREFIGSYYDPPPVVHPELKLLDPNKVQVPDDALPLDESAARVIRAGLSFLHGVWDARFYFNRLIITFFLVAIVALAALVVLIGVTRL